MYEFVVGPANWEDANTDAVNRGGYLLVIENMAEQNEVIDDGSGSGSGTETRQEPDDFASNQDAAAVCTSPSGWGNGNLGVQFQWNDINEDNQLPYIIEYPVN